MAQFSLSWDNSAVLTNTNSISQRCSYKLRTSDTWLTTGFSPTNDMAKTVITANSTSGLGNNVVYQFKVENICTSGGPTINDNGIQEGINFSCISPTLTETSTTGTLVLDTTGTDITAARVTLKLALDNSIIVAPTIISVSSNSITANATGLTASTNYYWQVELYAIVNNITVISSDTTQMGSICSPYPFTTGAPPVCNPVTAGTISSIQTG
jgi:hypothetical protein